MKKYRLKSHKVESFEISWNLITQKYSNNILVFVRIEFFSFPLWKLWWAQYYLNTEFVSYYWSTSNLQKYACTIISLRWAYQDGYSRRDLKTEIPPPMRVRNRKKFWEQSEQCNSNNSASNHSDWGQSEIRTWTVTR